MLNKFQTPDSDDCDGFYQYMLEECPSTNINLNFVPKNFDEIPQFLEHLTSRPAAARLLFFSDREVFQKFGFIIKDGVMYVNKLSDIQFCVQYKTPFICEHNMAPDPNMMKTVSYESLFSKEENFFANIINYSHELMNINLELNRDFLDMILKLQGCSLDRFEAEMKEKKNK